MSYFVLVYLDFGTNLWYNSFMEDLTMWIGVIIHLLIWPAILLAIFLLFGFTDVLKVLGYGFIITTVLFLIKKATNRTSSTLK